MSSIVGWYSEERHRLVKQAIPDTYDLSFTADLDQFFNESVILTMRPDQLEKMQKLEKLYGESLDENTRLFAKHYKDCMNSDSTSNKRERMIPMFPIAEPPTTPLHEVSRSIPDYVKFGPILPKSAGFSPMLNSKYGAREASRTNVSSTTSQILEESAGWNPQEDLLDENEDDSEYEADDGYVDSDEISNKSTSLSRRTMVEDKETRPKALPYEIKIQTRPNSSIFSPLDSPKTPSPKIPSPKPDKHFKKGHLRLMSPRIRDLTVATSLPASPHIRSDSSISSADSDGEAAIETQKICRKIHSRRRRLSCDNVNIQVVENSSIREGDEGSQSFISLPTSDKSVTRTKPPKDFVCPITSHIFGDPVTLETGQTFERKAIQEWLESRNTTCPITRQPLSATTLPKTNYVLKKLITSWKEQYPDLAQEFSYSETPRDSFGPHSSKETPLASTLGRTSDFSCYQSVNEHLNIRSKRFARASAFSSPTSVISQAEVETIINGLKPYVSCLCNSENLQECEEGVLAMSGLWKDSKADPGVQSYLSNPVNGFVEILSASKNREVLRTSIYILSELLLADESIREALSSVDSDFDCLAALLKNGLAEAASYIPAEASIFSTFSS